MGVEKITDEEFIFLCKLGFQLKNIAEMKKMCYNAVWMRSKKLTLEGYIQRWRGPANPAGLISYNRLRGQHHIAKAKALVEKRGVIASGDLTSYTRRLLKNERFLVPIRINLMRGSGGYKRFMTEKVFKKRYLWKTYYCLASRTVIVRFLIKVLKKIKTKHQQILVTRFLREYLTEAERVAVLWKLGVRCWRTCQVSSSMQVDGVHGPARRYRSKSENLNRSL